MSKIKRRVIGLIVSEKKRSVLLFWNLFKDNTLTGIEGAVRQKEEAIDALLRISQPYVETDAKEWHRIVDIVDDMKETTTIVSVYMITMDFERGYHPIFTRAYSVDEIIGIKMITVKREYLNVLISLAITEKHKTAIIENPECYGLI